MPAVVLLARVKEAILTQLPHIELGALLSARFHSPLAPGQSFVVRQKFQGERTRYEVRLADASPVEPGILIASGEWACRSKHVVAPAGA